MALSQRIRMRHLRVFLALCEHKTLTRTAEALNTVQPALSRTLKELEDEIGAPLFERTSKGLKLTVEGEGLREHLAAGLAQIEQGVQIASGHRRAETVSVGMLPNVARTLLPRAVERFKAADPEVTVRLNWSSAPDLVAMMRRGEIDFLASRMLSLEDQPGIVFEHLYSEPIVFVVRTGHPLAEARGLIPHDLEPYIVVLPQHGTIIRSEVDRFLFSLGYGEFPNRIETVSFEFVRTFAAGTDAVVCIPMGGVRQELARGSLVRLAMRGEEILGSVGLSFLKERDLTPAARRLMRCIRDVVEDGAFL